MFYYRKKNVMGKLTIKQLFKSFVKQKKNLWELRICADCCAQFFYFSVVIVDVNKELNRLQYGNSDGIRYR